MTEKIKHCYTLEQPNRITIVEGPPDVQGLAPARYATADVVIFMAGAERSEPGAAGTKAYLKL